MKVSANVMYLDSPPAQTIPVILDSLPVPATFEEREMPRRARLQIDLILLAIEALDLSGSEAILTTASELELQDIIKNRVNLWRLRSANPLRRFSQRRSLSVVEAKALVVIASYLARRMTVLIRQLLLAYQQLSEKQLSMEHHFRLSDYLDRFRKHFRSRMNPRRSGVIAYTSDEKLNDLAISLLGELLFCTGTAGMQRFWSSLFDGEI
ncbi:DUF3038 domain-containing protein [Argonema galeatum]|uniref:DUF3038 domain-containing protein n=1 Tax=Argonema galeatum TaxID=2942762 RepID=UPI002013BC87|nr:DUF3038 domain-containing protein [Argonema galeatum]MCL1467919.1 DUF3038 domain-containing protein [Argonema galeatum A003/A1]